MTRATFTIEKYPRLVAYFASRNPGHLLVMILPILGWFLSLVWRQPVEWPLALGLVLVGVLWWSFLEYAIHRWAYHSTYPTQWLHAFFGSFHLFHHVDMSDRRVYNAGFLMVYLLAPLVLAPAWVITQSLSLTALFGLGTLGAYFGYECVHFLLHYRVFESGYLAWIQRYHFYHHERRPNKNFGNTSALWDLILGTHDVGHRTYRLSRKAQATTILARGPHG